MHSKIEGVWSLMILKRLLGISFKIIPHIFLGAYGTDGSYLTKLPRLVADSDLADFGERKAALLTDMLKEILISSTDFKEKTTTETAVTGRKICRMRRCSLPYRHFCVLLLCRVQFSMVVRLKTRLSSCFFPRSSHNDDYDNITLLFIGSRNRILM